MSTAQAALKVKLAYVVDVQYIAACTLLNPCPAALSQVAELASFALSRLASSFTLGSLQSVCPHSPAPLRVMTYASACSHVILPLGRFPFWAHVKPVRLSVRHPVPPEENRGVGHGTPDLMSPSSPTEYVVACPVWGS